MQTTQFQVYIVGDFALVQTSHCMHALSRCSVPKFYIFTRRYILHNTTGTVLSMWNKRKCTLKGKCTLLFNVYYFPLLPANQIFITSLYTVGNCCVIIHARELSRLTTNNARQQTWESTFLFPLKKAVQVSQPPVFHTCLLLTTSTDSTHSH